MASRGKRKNPVKQKVEMPIYVNKEHKKLSDLLPRFNRVTAFVIIGVLVAALVLMWLPVISIEIVLPSEANILVGDADTELNMSYAKLLFSVFSGENSVLKYIITNVEGLQIISDAGMANLIYDEISYTQEVGLVVAFLVSYVLTVCVIGVLIALLILAVLTLTGKKNSALRVMHALLYTLSALLTCMCVLSLVLSSNNTESFTMNGGAGMWLALAASIAVSVYAIIVDNKRVKLRKYGEHADEMR